MDPLLLCDRADQDHDELRDTSDQQQDAIPLCFEEVLASLNTTTKSFISNQLTLWSA